MNLRSILLACLAAAQARAEPVKIACFGDSVTEGTNSKGKPWCKEIRGVLGRNFFTTYNFGQSGATVTNVGTNSAPYIGSGKYADWRAAVTDSCEDKDCCEAGCARSPFQVGIISLGTNDAKTANLAAYNEATFRAQYQSLITNIVQDLYDPDDGGDCPGGGSDLQLLVLASAVPIAGPPISQTNDGAWDGDSALWVADTLPRLVNLTSAWAANEFDGLTVKYVDLYDVLSSREDYPDSLYDDDDRIHPRPEGHAVMAAALAAKVQEWCDGSDECDTTRACGDDSLFYPLEGDADDYEIDNSDENPYNITGFASFGGITYGGFDAEHVVECNVECDTADCFEDAVERSNGNPENVPLIVCLTADIVTTSKNEPSGDEEGSLTIDGQGHTISYGDEDCIGIRGASNIVIKNVHFKNVDAGNDKTAVKIRQNDDGDVAHHVVIQSCTFSCEGSKCDDTDAAVVVEAPSTFVSIQKCKFDGLDRAVYIRNKKDDCDGHGAGRVTISESVFLDSRRETPRVQVGWVHVYNSLWIGGGDSSDGMVLTDPENGAKPEILVEACSFDRVDDAYENDGDGTIAESAVVMDSDSRDDADTAYAPSSLSWCVPYDYDVVNASDPAAIQRLMDAAGAPAAPTAVPTAGPSPQPTAEPTPRPTDDTPAPTPAPTTPSPTSPAPTPAPTTPSPTSPAPTPAPTTAAPTVTQAPTLPVGSPAAGACLAAGGDCNSCCRGCKPKTTEDAGDVGFDFSTDPSLAAGECVCFEGALYDKTLYEKAVTLTNANDCAKVTGDYVDYGGEGDDVLNAIGTIDYMRGGAGAGDSCTYNGDRRTDDAFGFITGCEAAPTPAPVTPSPTLSCDSPEKFYPETPNENGDGYKLTSEFSQMNPYNVTGFAAWADAGIAYGGFYGGKAVTCHDADCVEHALIETDGPLIIHLGKDIDLGDARYKIMGSKDHDDKTLEGHGFTLKYSFDDDGEAPLFTDAGASNLVIRNVRFENTGDTKERPAIQIRDGAHHVVLDQCTFTCSYAGECGYAVTIEAPATFVTIQRCLFDGLEKGIHVRNKRGDNGAGRVTIVESYFRNCEKESPDAEVGWIHMASCVVEGGGCNPDNDDCDDGMIKTDPDNGGVPEILVDGGRLSVAEGKLYRKDGGGLIAAVPGVTNSSEAPDAPEDLSWCVPYDYTPIDGFDDAAVKQTKENAGAQKEFPACGVRINRGKRQDPNDFQCVTDPKKMEHDGRKIAFACCTAHICTRKDPSGQCYAGNLKKSDFAPKDWYEATKVCADEGKVLCGVEEPCSGSGCLYDHHYQWTGQECQAGDANFPYECLWPGGVKVVPGIKDVAPYCETNPDALVRDDGTDMGIAFACCNEDESSGCTRKVDGSCNAGDWRKEKGTWAPVSWADAMEHCATYGKTLCGSSNAARCQNRGCYYNNIYQWTNEPCEPPEPPPTCLVVEPITDPSACPDVCPPACKDVLVTGGQCSGDGVCAPDDQGVLCTCTPPSARRLLAEPKEEYVFDVTELGECVPCSGACEVGECVPDSRRRGLRFGMSTSGCCCGA